MDQEEGVGGIEPQTPAHLNFRKPGVGVAQMPARGAMSPGPALAYI